MGNKTILVSGSNGFIGSLVVNELRLSSTNNVYGVSKGENRNPNLCVSNYRSIDLSDVGKLQMVLNEIRPDIVIHCAAISQVDVCEKNPQLCRQINILATEAIAQYCGQENKKMIFFSTDFVFDGSRKWQSEEDTPNPISVYAKSKWAAEQVVRNNCENWTIIRPVLVYGYSPVALRPNIFTWVVDSIKNNQPIHVVDDQFRTPTYVGDVVKFVWTIVKNELKGVYHIGGYETVSVYEFAKEIEKQVTPCGTMISPSSSTQVGGAQLRPLISCFSNRKINLELNWKATGLDNGIKDSLNTYLR